MTSSKTPSWSSSSASNSPNSVGTDTSSVSLDELEQDPHPFHDRAREAGDIVWVDALGGWLTLSHAIATRILRDDEAFTVDDPRFSTARVIGPSMLSTDGDVHRTHRAPFVDLFTRSRVNTDLGTWSNTLAETLAAEATTAPSTELRTELCGPYATEVIVHALDLQADPNTVLELYRAIAGAVGDLRADDDVPTDAVLAFKKLRSIIIASATPGSALDGPNAALDVDEMVSNAAVALFGAIETTEGAIANALHHLSVEGYSEIPDGDDLDRFIEESMRVEPAAAVVHRYATRAREFDEVTIEAGDFVVVSLSAANRDPALFDAPHRFNPARPNVRRHLTFATGPHVCFGAHLARFEVRCVLDALRPHFATVRLDSTPPTGLVFRKPAQVTARWHSV